jgi:formate hydrogenlyase subunit 3/multisubunit Na+/H+ antiporter MnhD subunit
MASIGLPGLNGFVGEVLSLGGMFRQSVWHAVLGTSGVVLGAWYLLTMVQQAFFGPLREPHHEGEPITDITPRELVAVVPICLLCLWIGVMPQAVIDTIRPDVDAVVGVYDEYLPGHERVARSSCDAAHSVSTSTARAVGVARPESSMGVDDARATVDIMTFADPRRAARVATTTGLDPLNSEL